MTWSVPQRPVYAETCAGLILVQNLLTFIHFPAKVLDLWRFHSSLEKYLYIVFCHTFFRYIGHTRGSSCIFSHLIVLVDDASHFVYPVCPIYMWQGAS